MVGVGIMKIYFDDTPERTVENYTGLDENQLQALLGDPMVEVSEIERSETEGIAVTCSRIVRQGRVVVEAVPCSEFRINDDADSLNVQEARFCAHTVRRSASDLLAAGYDPELIESAQQEYLDREVGEYTLPSSLDESQKQIVVTEATALRHQRRRHRRACASVVYTGESTPTRSSISRRFACRSRLLRCRRSRCRTNLLACRSSSGCDRSRTSRRPCCAPPWTACTTRTTSRK